MINDSYVVVVGSLNVDLVQTIERLPMPGETLAGGDLRVIPGGKGANQACTVAKLGGPAAMIGNVGSDPFGALLLESLRFAGVAVAGVESVGGSSGAASILVLPDGENSIVISGGANARLTGEDVARRIRRLTARIVMCQLEVPMDATESALIEARTSGAVTILDPAPAKPLPPAVLSRVDYLTPNQVEAATLLGVARRIETVEDAMDAALKLLTLGPACVIVKIGRLGCVVATSAGTEWISGFEVRAVDTTAAGDVFNGAFAAALAQDRPVREAARIANAAAAISVTRAGAQSSIPSQEEVERLLENGSMAATS